ncbi:MAG: CinA family nicotinamide mononucleotide deamidase-related protein [Thermaceae bacterium]|nr:CinA family nicotinamide mononucleotide deamidase-related protein [Thermaceae bacterium]
MFIAEIIGVGDELLYGETVDTNTAELARSLQPYSLNIPRTLRVADDLAALSSELRKAWSSARLIVLSGGLGPTPDDITREAIAAALGEALELDQAMLNQIRAIFAARGWNMPESNRKQAMKIPSATWILNPRGTAPGWWVHQETPAPRDLIALPGPPAEWRPMWAELLPKLGLPPQAYAQKTFKTLGIGESRIVEVLGGLFQREGPATVGTYAKAHGVEVTVRGQPEAVQRLAEEIAPKLQEYLWGEDADTLPGVVLRGLEARGATLATIESLSGGVLGALVTEVAGASRAYLGGMVAYSVGAKQRFGVSDEALSQGTVSEACARAMAEAARKALGATYALATTGVAGPDELEGQPVGTVFVALAGPQKTQVRPHRFPPYGREFIRTRAAYAALALLQGALR